MSANKAALFAVGPAKAGPKKTVAAVPAHDVKATGSRKPAPVPVKPLGLSATQRDAKRAEAAKLQAAGDEYVATSMFKWSADHLGAAPKYEAAANAFNAAGDARRAWGLMEKAAQSHVETGAFGAAGNALTAAAKIAAKNAEAICSSSESSDSSDSDSARLSAVGLRVRAAEMWLLYGDLVQGAVCYCAAAALAEAEAKADGGAHAAELYVCAPARVSVCLCVSLCATLSPPLPPPNTHRYLLARDSVLPSGALSTEAEVKTASVRCLDLLRQICSFLYRDSTRLAQALEHSRLLLLVCVLCMRVVCLSFTQL